MRFALLCSMMLVLVACETETEKPHEAGTPATNPAHVAATAPAPPTQVPYTGSPTIDQVTIGDEKSEAAHNQKGENTETGEYGGGTYRHSQGGWFSWDLKVIPNQPNNLILTYWGSDQRSFTILVDGTQLVAERIANDHPEEFFDKTYMLTPAMTKDKQKVTVKFQSPANGYAGGVFGIKMMYASASATKPAK